MFNMKSKKISKDKLNISKMASGNTCLFLTDEVSWSQFGIFAHLWMVK